MGLIDTSDISLDEWLKILFDPPEDAIFVHYCFPNRNVADQYIETIAERSDQELYALLGKFLLPSCSFNTDEFTAAHLRQDLPRLLEDPAFLHKNPLHRRLLLWSIDRESVLPWEGITWVLYLLPQSPQMAIEAINHYLTAHYMYLPDGRIEGLYCAMEVIRARFIGLPGTQSEKIGSLLNLSSRDFEHVIESLYHKMEYKTELTPSTRDGGYDVLARSEKPGSRELLLVECKRYSGTVGIGFVRQLAGSVMARKANKGTMCTTGDFSKPARQFASENELELISGEELVRLLNTHWGPEWPLTIDRIIGRSRERDQKQREMMQ